MREQLQPPEDWPPPPSVRVGCGDGLDKAPLLSTSFWIIESDEGPMLAYGWTIPSWNAAQNAWSRQEVAKIASAKLWRVTCTVGPQETHAMLQALWKGSSLTDASCRAGCDLPSGIPGGSLQFARGTPASTAYAATPWTFLPKGSALAGPSHAQPRTSPNHDAPAIATSLIARDKGTLLSRLAASPDDANDLLAHLESETGFLFTGHDAERLGDFEFFLFHAAYADERSRARVRFQPHPIVDIELPEGTRLAVRCRQTIAGMILADELKTLQARAGVTTVEFAPTADGPHPTTIEIWAGDDGVLWFSEELIAIRRFELQGRLMGTTIEFDSDWLKKWHKSRRHRDDAARMKQIARPSPDRVSTVGEPDAEFIAAAFKARRWVEKRRPKKSGARYFPKGEKLEFATWLRDELTSARGVAAAILFDPFIEAWGLEMFARLENPNCRFEIITALERPGGEGETRTRLLGSLKDLLIALEGLHLRVHAFTGSRPFHDRFLLAFDDAGEVVRGFHLSNSLEGAAEKFPLLVTPIPDDVLAAVANDCANLLATEEPRLELLYETANRRPRTPPRPDLPRSDQAPEDALEQLLAEPNAELTTRWTAFASALYRHADARKVLVLLSERAAFSLYEALGRWLTAEALSTPEPVGVSDVPETRDALSILTLYRSQFADVVAIARHKLDRGGGRPTAYPVVLALRVLVDNAPALFVSVIDTLVERARAVSPLDSAIGTVLCAATSTLTEPLIFAPTDGVVDACFASKTPFVRGLAAAALGAVLMSPSGQIRLPPDRILGTMTGLDPQERLVAIAEWIGHLRINANRNDGEGPETRTLRAALMNHLVQRWPDNVGQDLLLDVVRRAEGPIGGRWVADTTSDLLKPLVEAQKSSWQTVCRVWLALLKPRMLETTDGRATFSEKSDIPLTEVVAQMCAAFGDPRDLEPWETAAKKARRIAVRPFARAQYAQSRPAADRLLWLEAFANLIRKSAPNQSPIADAAGRILAQTRELAPSWLEERRESGVPAGFVDFVEQARGRGSEAPVRTPVVEVSTRLPAAT